MEQVEQNFSLKKQVCAIVFKEFEKFNCLRRIELADKYSFNFWLSESCKKMKIVEENTILYKKRDKIESLFFILEGTVDYLDECNDVYLQVGPY